MSAPIALAPKLSASEEARRDVVRILEEALELAKSGEVAECIVIMKLADNCWRNEVSRSLVLSEMIGRMEITKAELVNAYIADSK